MSNAEQLNKLAQIFNTDKIISKDEINAILTGIVSILANNKQGIDQLDVRVQQALESALNKIASEHNWVLQKVDAANADTKNTVTSEMQRQVKAALKRVDALVAEVRDIMPQDGKDADETLIVEELLKQIKLPEVKDVILDDGEQIVEKINGLNVAPENQIDWSHIKNAPEFRQRSGGGLSRATADTLYAPLGSGSGTVPTFVDNETPGGSINGSNTAFTLAHAPNPAASLILILNGQYLTQGVDYTLSTTNITMTTAPDAGFSGLPFKAFYRY